MHTRLPSRLGTVLLVLAVACGGSDSTTSPEVGGEDGGGRDAGPSLSCADRGCADHQLCADLVDGGVACLPECRPGRGWNGTACELIGGMDCSEGGAMSILDACTGAHRACTSIDDGAECGACLAGFVEEGDDCVARRTCPLDACDEAHRVCDDSDSSAHARCGGCLGGFRLQGQECIADVEDPSCVDVCGVNQVCVEDPTPRCLMQCENGWIWSEDDHGCRPELTCADIQCMGAQICDEGAEGLDARCLGASCPEDQGRNQAGACEACSGWRNCTGMTGATGEVLATTQGCRCQPDEGYFINATGVPQLCDTDADGWVNDQAAGTIEAADPRLAACDLRSITSVVLINDAGEERTVALTPALPLYEHPTNDGSSSANPHPTYGVAVAQRALNSFTKACVTETGDFNRNGVDDVREHVNAQVTIDNARVVTYFSRYRAFAYFMELAEGWYSAPGVYTIRERPRVTTSFPLRYAQGAADRWQTCTRHVDSAYLAGGFATQVGRDFAGYSALAGWGGMNHHSQFKCVRAVQSSSYDPAAPEQVYIANGSFQWAGPNAVAATPRNWTRNVCAGLDSYRDSPNAAVPNAALQDFACAASNDLAGLEGHVTWVAVGYVNGSQETETYERGCINECAEHDSLPDEAQCEANAGNPGFGCRADMQRFGTLACGCRRNFGGPGCALACPDSELLTNIDAAQFPDTTGGAGSESTDLRAGYWMCGGISASSNPVVSGSGYVLKGEISTTAVDGTVMSGGGYTLRAR